METCQVCGAEEFIPYVCRYCGGTHCVYHRLPENHDCPNIEQARAPKPYVKPSERKGAIVTLRPLGVPKLARFSGISQRELTAIVIAWAVLGISFSMRYLFLLRSGLAASDFGIIFLSTMIIIGLGFLGHELAHKFTAQRYGCLAEFKLWTYGAAMALLFAVVSQGSFVFAAPGAVYIMSRSGYFGETLDKKSNGIVSIVGPLVNVAVAGIFSALLVAVRLFGYSDVPLPLSTVSFGFLAWGIALNLWLAAFNMLPIFILDGQKVFVWDKKVWALLALPLWAIALVFFFV